MQKFQSICHSVLHHAVKISFKWAFFSILWVLLSHIAQHSLDNSQKMGIGAEDILISKIQIKVF